MNIDQLADQVQEAMSLAQARTQAQAQAEGSSAAAADATGPALPPGLALSSGKTVEEILADLNKSPLFMTELEENDDTAALQALAYEGTPLENAADFKERGNECFRARGFADAREFYAKGIAVLSAEERRRARGGEEETTADPDGVQDSEDEIAAQRDMLEAVYVNRAACHLELRNYRSCWTDCAAALRLNPRNVKAFYRSARALLAVDRVREAEDACARGLLIDPHNKALAGVSRDVSARSQAVEHQRLVQEERAARKRSRATLLRAALKARSIATRSTDKPPEMEDARLALVPDEDDPRSELAFPAVLLYPLRLESDFIKAFRESQALDEHLAYVLPPPWDRDGEYAAPRAVACFVETRDGGLVKMGRRVPLLKLLMGGRVEVVDEVVRIFVLPVSKADDWVEEFKMKKAAKGGLRAEERQSSRERKKRGDDEVMT